MESNVAQLMGVIAERDATIRFLQARILDLESRLSLNSRNSSKPPSSDYFQHPRASKAKTGKKVGGQSGHKGTTRDLLPESEVDTVIDCSPSHCGICGNDLSQEPILDTQVRQVTELSPAKPIVTHYRLHRKRCSKCGGKSRGKMPVGSPTGAFGPGVQAMVAVLSSRFRLSRRDVSVLMADLFGIQMSIASVQDACEKVSAAVADTVSALRAQVIGSGVVHVDETGFGTCKKDRMWLWGARTRNTEVFKVLPGRGRPQAKELLGEDFSGILQRDRWKPYECFTKARSQLCWSHLLRHFQAISEATGYAAQRGQQLLQSSWAIFNLWHQRQEEFLEQAIFMEKVGPLRREIHRELKMLTWGDRGIPSKIQGTANDLLRQWESMWLFLDTPGVVPTNNAAEQCLRKAVIWRKASFGANSKEGCRFVERMLSIIGTAKLRKINLMQWISATMTAALSKKCAPEFA